MKTLKEGILKAMKNADGKPIKELTDLFDNADFRQKMTTLFEGGSIRNADDLIKAIDNNFEKIFKLIE